MRKVLLLGDSIRLGYCQYVKDNLKNSAEVIYPEDNCRFTQYTYVELSTWLDLVSDPENLAAIHWNNGHWDVARWAGSGEPLNSLPQYCQMLERIYLRLAERCPKAIIIFALTTPMNPSGIQGKNLRTNPEIRKYNHAATEVIQRLGGAVNDLFALMEDQPALIYQDHAHYTETGYRRLADKVSQVISNVL